MRILKNNYLKEKEDKIVCNCEWCDSELEFDKEELEVGDFGLYRFTCPCCNKVSSMDDGIKLDENNLEYPKHFANYSNSNEIDDEEINEWIKECVKIVKETDDYNYIIKECGNTIVIATPYYDENKYINIIVAKDYKSVDIDFD